MAAKDVSPRPIIHVSPEVRQKLKVIAAKEGTSIQDVAIRMLLAAIKKRGE